jgi:hypothetical protein
MNTITNNWIQLSTQLYPETTKDLLTLKNTDPTNNNNFAIRNASEKGHLEIVKLLLQHSKVDPTSKYNYAIRWASYNGHLEVVKLLLKDSRVDPQVLVITMLLEKLLKTVT